MYSKLGASHGSSSSFVYTDQDTQIWVHPEASCAVPAFNAETTIDAQASAWVDDESGCPFCASLDIKMLDEEGGMQYPLSVTFGDVINARNKIQPNQTIKLKLASFIEAIQVWPDVAAFNQAHANTGFGPGINWYIPLGRHAAVESMRNAQPRAAFYGVVKTVQTLMNNVTNTSYRKVQVECRNTLYDCVLQLGIAPQLSTGNVVYIEAWLVADLAESKPVI